MKKHLVLGIVFVIIPVIISIVELLLILLASVELEFLYDLFLSAFKLVIFYVGICFINKYKKTLKETDNSNKV